MKRSRNALIVLAAMGTLALFFRLLPEPPGESGKPVEERPDRGQATFAVTGVRVFDGERFIEDTDVVVANGRIQAFGRDAAIPEGAEVVSGEGRTLLPGLIDSHVHTFGDALEQALRFGVTTALDMFTSPDHLDPARERRASLEEQAVADLWSAGVLATAPGGHGTQFGIDIPTIDAPEQAPDFVEARLAEGSDYIKIVYDDGAAFGTEFQSIDRATLDALVAAAHDRGVMAVVHASDLRSARHAIRAGADGLVHVFADRPADQDFISRIRESGAFVIPTLSVLESVAGTGHGLLEDERLAPYLAPAQRQQLRAGFGEGRGQGYIEQARDNARRLHEAGVPVLAGSDAPNPGTAHGASLHRELELLTESGLSNAQALAAATSVPADAFGLDDRGRIAEGKIADLLLVEGDPSRDITATRAIHRLWKDGRPVGRERPKTGATAAAPAPEHAAISDFDGALSESNGTLAADFGFGWQTTSDAMRGGNSRAAYELVSPGTGGAGQALAVTGEVKSGFTWPWAGVIFFPATEPMQPVDFSGKSELVFHAQGDGGTYTVMMFSGPSAQGMPAWVNFDTGGVWRQVRIPLSDFQGSDPALIRGIAFTAGPRPGSFQFAIDNVAVR